MLNNKTLNMDALADHIIAVAKENKLPITNLQLHKIMYFTLKLAKEDELIDIEILKKMYDQPFEVWELGPVVRLQYLRFRRFSCEFIIGTFKQTSELKPLNPIIIDLLKENPFTLAEISTRLPFWVQNHNKIKDGISDIKYNFDDI